MFRSDEKAPTARSEASLRVLGAGVIVNEPKSHGQGVSSHSHASQCLPTMPCMRARSTRRLPTGTEIAPQQAVAMVSREHARASS
jgi:hypothetical protein